MYKRQALEPRPEVHDDYFERTQDALRKTVWAQDSVAHSWYKAADGNIYGLSPWRLVDFWGWTREPDLDDFILQ